MEAGEKSFLAEFDTSKKTGTIKVLTILTFIGCGLQFLGTLVRFFTAKESYERMDQVANSDLVDKMPSFLRGLYSADAVEVAKKSLENRLPLLIIELIAVALCLYGAIKMRQLKQEGYTAWLIGELLPFAGSIIFIGAVAFKGVAFYFGVIVILVFIALYTSQRKNLS